MPTQNSFIKLSGRMGDVIHYIRKDRKNQKKYFTRWAPVTVRQTAATKRAAADFGTASKYSTLIRRALHEHTIHCHDRLMHSNLNKKMAEIVHADINHPSGQRAFTTANLQSLQHFRFNSAARMQYNAVIENSDTGTVSISFPDTFGASGNTTHIALKAIALLVNFSKGTTQQVETNTVMIKRGEKCGALTMNLNRKDLTLIILEIQSFYEVNGELHLSQNKQACVLDVIAVLAPLEKPVASKREYRNKAPHFWMPYAAPAKPALIAVPLNCMPLPEG